MTAGYAFSMQETNKTKKRQTSDPSMEWTSTLVRFLKDLLSEVASSANSTSQGPGNFFFLVVLISIFRYHQSIDLGMFVSRSV